MISRFPGLSPEVIERAVRMLFDARNEYASQWTPIESIAGKIGCSAETLRKWVRQGERDSGLSCVNQNESRASISMRSPARQRRGR